jgi:DNA-binding IclR family transcriptional regulator
VIPADLADFIHSSIKSVWSAELLLFLRRRRERSWTPDQLIQELRSSRSVVLEVLATFEQAGLVTREGGSYRFAPASDELDRLTQELEAAYSERPATVVKAIMSAPSDKLKIFADAFRLKKD